MIALPRGIQAVLLALLLTTAAVGAAAPVGAAGSVGGSDTVSSEVRSAATWSGLSSDDVVTYGVEAHPGFVAHYSEGEHAAVEEWANSSDDRRIHHHDNGSNYAVLSAPAHQMGVTDKNRLNPFNNGLAAQSYVEYVELNMRHSYAEPLSRLESQEEAHSKPQLHRVATWGGIKGNFGQEGVAYKDDANETTMQEARQHHAADSSGYSGAGVNISVVDTGLNYNQDIYQDRVIAGYNALTDTEANITLDADGTANVSQSDYSELSETNLHGSFVTSQAAANTTGTNASYMGAAPDAQIIAVRALNDEGRGSTQQIAQGIDYACSNGADVVSLSLGSAVQQEAIATEISECYEEHGVSAVVAAVGNSRQTTRYVSYPASEEAEQPVISVAAVSGGAPSEQESAYFSNVAPRPENGAEVTVAATGMRVVAQIDDGSGTLQTRSLSGTSMSTPIVSGVAAHALEADSALQGDAVELRARMVRTASPIPAAGETEAGAGSINASNLVTDTEPESSQSEAKSTQAAARDGANRAVAGSTVRAILA